MKVIKKDYLNILKENALFIFIMVLVSALLNFILYDIINVNYIISNTLIFMISILIYFIKFRLTKNENKVKTIVNFLVDNLFILFLQKFAFVTFVTVLKINIFVSSIVIYIISYIYITLSIKKDKEISDKAKGFRSLLTYSLPIAFVFYLVLLAYWPGILVSDSVVQWNQAQTGMYTNWHPIFATLSIKVISLFWNTPGLVLFVQSMILSFSFGYAISKVEKYYKVNRIFLILVAIIFALFPLNYNSAITMLKDTIYSTFILVLTAIVIEIVNNKKWLNKWYNMVFIIFSFLVISLFRHNGIIALVLLAITLFIVLKDNRKKIAIITISWAVSYVVLNMVVNSALSVTKATYANTYGPVSHIFARMLNTPGVEFADEEIKTMEKYVDIEKLKDTYMQFNMDPSINAQDIEALKGDSKEYIKLCIKKILEYPSIFVKQYVKLSSFLYSPLQIEEQAYTIGMFEETDLWKYKDVYPELEENSKLPGLLVHFKDFTSYVQQSKFDFIVKRPALWMYASIAMIIFIAIKYKNKKIYLILLPSIYNSISLIPALPVHMTRYIYGTILVGYLIIPWGIYEIYDSIKKNVRKGISEK